LESGLETPICPLFAYLSIIRQQENPVMIRFNERDTAVGRLLPMKDGITGITAL
jgi:hypothetical protein